MDQFLSPRLVAERLFSRAAKMNGCPLDERFEDDLDDLLANPHFEEGESWQQFVDKEIKVLWDHFDRITKLVIYITALKTHHDEVLKLPELPISVPYHGSRGVALQNERAQ